MNYNWKQPNHKYGRNLISSLRNWAHECQKGNLTVLLCRIVIPTSKENSVVSSSFCGLLTDPEFYLDLSIEISTRAFDMHTANVYSDLRI